MYKIKSIEKVKNGFNIIKEENTPTKSRYQRNITYSFIFKKRLTNFEKEMYLYLNVDN